MFKNGGISLSRYTVIIAVCTIHDTILISQLRNENPDGHMKLTRGRIGSIISFFMDDLKMFAKSQQVLDH